MKPGIRELTVSGTDMETHAFPFLCAQRLFFVQLCTNFHSESGTDMETLAFPFYKKTSLGKQFHTFSANRFSSTSKQVFQAKAWSHRHLLSIQLSFLPKRLL